MWPFTATNKKRSDAVASIRDNDFELILYGPKIQPFLIYAMMDIRWRFLRVAILISQRREKKLSMLSSNPSFQPWAK